MKTKLLLLLIFATGFLNAQVVNKKSVDDVVDIPDPNFLYRLLNHADMFGGVHIDTNSNGQIEVSEAEAISVLILGSNIFMDNQIIDMTGIEAFINLTSIQCTYNQIESIDFSQNTLLEYIECDHNNINALNISQCSVLTELQCRDNGLTTLDISNNTLLEGLYCFYNNLTSLIIGNNTSLKDFFCGFNHITSLNLANCTSLERLSFFSNNIIDIDVSHNMLLTLLSCGNNQITNLDVSSCTQLEELWGGGNQLLTIDLSLNNNLRKVFLENNQLTSIDIQNNNNENITQFITTNNPNLACIFVDDAIYSTNNWTEIDANSHFVETQAECDAIGIDDIQSPKSIVIIPNPVKDVFTINNQLAFDSISIYNNIGSLVRCFKKQDSYSIKGLSSGIYIIKINGLKSAQLKKIIKR